MRLLAPLALAAAVSAVSLPAMAQFQKPEDAIKYRQSSFVLMANHFGRIKAMIDGKVPFDAKVAADNAAVVEMMSKLPWGAFGPGTDMGTTKALPAVWSEQAKFKEGADKMQVEAGKLVAAAKTGNLDNLKAAFGGVGQTCKACHDNFKEK